MSWALRFKVCALLAALVLLSGCGKSAAPQPEESENRAEAGFVSSEMEAGEEESSQMRKQHTENNGQLRLYIDGEAVQVVWEDNGSVSALEELCEQGPLEVAMSMYGGFEQVGDVGQSLPRSDKQTTTQAGDIVLYAGDSVVVFYGSNSWSYTRLGRITDRSEAELTQLLGNGDVKLTFALE